MHTLSSPARLLLLTFLAILAYLPTLAQPFISDDYLQIHLGRVYGPVSAWPSLAGDALYRCRATSIVLTLWTEQALGLSPAGFYATAIALHAAATYLLYLTATRKLGFDSQTAFLGAVFFAVYEGHQEAIMWYAAVPELLLLLACLGFTWFWIDWIETGRTLDYGLAFGCFVLALLSKEPGVILVPVALSLLYWKQRLHALWPYVTPMAALAVAYSWGIFAAKANHLHLNDGTFSLSAPFVQTYFRSVWRMFWFWGILSVVALRGRVPMTAAFWIAVSLPPYCFLTYMPHVPSRHIYLASAGLALIVGAALAGLDRRHRNILLVVILAHNLGYLWLKKREQFVQRAEPTEQLLKIAREKGAPPLAIGCFPFTREVGDSTVQVMLGWKPGSLQWAATADPAAHDFCSKEAPRANAAGPR